MPGDSHDFLPPDINALTDQPAAISADAQPTRASRVLDAQRDRLMALSGVVAVGETLDATGREAILIGVKTARSLARLPREVDGVPVVSQVIGEVDAQ